MKNVSHNALWVAALASLAGMPAMAQQNAGAIASSLGSQVNQIGSLLMVIAAVAGVFIAIAGLLKFRAHSQNPNDPSNKLSSAFTLIFVGAAMVAVPALLGTGISTIFGTGASTTTGEFGLNLGSGGE